METGLADSFIANYNIDGAWAAFIRLLARYRTASMADVLQTLSL
jgi:hypothetical protein